MYDSETGRQHELTSTIFCDVREDRGLIWDWFGTKKAPDKHRLGSVNGDQHGPAIFFVHGLSGKPDTTWGPMLGVCSTDTEISKYTLDCFGYPTVLFPFFRKMSKLQEIARGLATELKYRHSQRSDITLVAHSLGGLIARQYILAEIKAGRTPLANRLLLYAVPNTGAKLAQLGKLLSWRDGHLSQLCRRADILELLNEDWVRFDVEAKLPVHYVVGGADEIVDVASARPFIGQDNYSTIIAHDHRSVVRAESIEDIRYKVLQHFVLGKPAASKASDIGTADFFPARSGDCLFDIYNPADESYYIERHADAVLTRAMSIGHVWLTGSAGVGKTSALRRSILKVGWRLQQIMLGSYVGRPAIGLLRAMCLELADIQGSTEYPPVDADPAELISFFRRRLRLNPANEIVALLIEEIPISSGPEFARFLELVLALLLSIAADNALNGRVVLAFSSINDPASSLPPGMSKMRERLQLCKLDPWDNAELLTLVNVITPEINPGLPTSDRQSIAVAANGSPRYVKMVFRRWRNGTANGLGLRQLLDSVAAEQV